MSEAFPPLDPIEQRILGTLCEKQRTVPDTYPLSLNALLAGCNQKSSRHPVMEVTEAGAVRALESLQQRGLVEEVSGSRVTRFGHRIEKALGVPTQASALLAVLLLRGPQTAGELRLNCERMHAFADISAVEAFLSELAERPAGALVVELPRAPGTRETRWAQLLGGMPAAAPAAARATPADADLSARVAALENDVAALREQLADLRARLGD